MSFNKLLALVTLAVLMLVGFASTVAINPNSPKPNLPRHDDAFSTSVDASASETDAKRDLAHHRKVRNLTTFMERDKGDLITPTHKMVGESAYDIYDQ
jgi:hypothetical protein